MNTDDSESVKPDPYAALRFPEFRAYLLMRFFLTFGYQIQAVVIGWYIYHLTKDPLSLGLIGLCEAIPAVSISLYGGYVADKSEKTKLLKIIIGGMIACSTVLYLITLPTLSSRLSTAHLVGIIYMMIFCIGICRGFMGPTTFSLMSLIVPRALYPNSSTWNSTGFQIAAIGGPAAGGLIYAFAGISFTFLLILIFLSIALCCIFLIKKREPVFMPKESIFESLSVGIKFVFGNRMMLGAMSLDMFSVFFGGAVALIPVIASEVLHVGAEGFGIMRATPAIGAVLTMLFMARHSPMNKPWRNLLIAVTGFGVSIICYGLSTNFYLTLFFLFFEGVFDSVSVVIRSTIMQLLTPDNMRGRVSAVNSMFIGSSNEIGAFESGLTARLMGTVPAVVFGGTMTLIIVSVTYFKTKVLVPLGLKEIE
ncbi:putative transporter [Arcticibacter svalbardensis MN12-7]|uniref:Putative transporter n=1 Tax=Arcticibacter svalbardensis MN12-7 TaxID=1150600 RepID=R9GRU3_9SPHI|nr:MFS transporter [Arcticibacter svalbardensis]EOR94255.1 putative transporter [Arcticibacter svalbardensis MN12-7]